VVSEEIGRTRLLCIIDCSATSMPGEHWWNLVNGSGEHATEEVSQRIDLARYFGGEVVRVYAQSGLRSVPDIPDFELSDVGTVVLAFESGALGEISNTCLLSGGGATGMYVITEDAVVQFHKTMVKTVRDGRVNEHYSTVNPYFEESRAFIEAIQNSDQSRVLSSYSDALATLRVALAARDSAQSHKPIRLIETRTDELIVGSEPVDNPEL
jgi:predicted dehydrogenase